MPLPLNKYIEWGVNFNVSSQGINICHTLWTNALNGILTSACRHIDDDGYNEDVVVDDDDDEDDDDDDDDDGDGDGVGGEEEE